MKTQWPRSADEPGVYMAQTGTRDGQGDTGDTRLVHLGRGDRDGATPFSFLPTDCFNLLHLYIFFSPLRFPPRVVKKKKKKIY